MDRLPGFGIVGGWIATFATLAFLWWFPDERSRMLLRTTVGLAGAATICSVPPATVLAWLLVRTNLPFRKTLTLTMLIPLLIPLYMHAACWEAGFGRLGWFTALAPAGQPPLLTGFRGAVWVHALAAVPWAFVIAAAHLRTTQSDLELAARLDSAPWGVFWHITLPQVAPAAALAAVWTFVWVGGEMTVTDLFQVRTYAEVVYVGYAVDTLEEVSPTTPSWPAGILLVGILVFASSLTAARLLPAMSAADEPSPHRLGASRYIGFALVLAAAVLLFMLPVGNLVYKAGLVFQQGRTPWWSIRQLTQLVSQASWEHRVEFGWSLAMSQLASLAALCVAFPLAFWSTRSTRAAVCTIVLGVSCFAIPAPILGVSLARLFSSGPDWLSFLYSRTIAAPVLAMSIKCFPLAVGMFWVGLRRIHREIFESASLAGASSYHQLTTVAIPVQCKLAAVVFLMGMILNMGDLAASILVVPPGVSTIAIRIFGLIHYGVENRLAALCLSAMGLFLVLGLVLRVATYVWESVANSNTEPA